MANACVANIVVQRCATGLYVMAVRTSCAGCLEFIRGVAGPAVEDFTYRNGLQKLHSSGDELDITIHKVLASVSPSRKEVGS